MSGRLHLAVELGAAGRHPGAWRLGDADPARLFTAPYHLDLVRTAARGGLDLVALPDSLQPPGADPAALPGTLDAVAVAARVAPAVPGIGVVPTVTVTHTEPFHLSKAVATLDFVSTGRAGWQPEVSRTQAEADLFGRARADRDAASLWREAGEVIEVAARLWDSWEDDAEIRDALTGRFVDRDKLHRVDFAGEHFGVAGPSIVPRPPQGQPLVLSLAHGYEPALLAARVGDVVATTPHDADDAVRIVAQVRSAEAAAGRTAPPLRILGDVVVVLADTRRAARERLARLDALDPLSSDAAILATTPAGLADTLLSWRRAGLDGYRLRPAVLPTDLDAVVDGLVPELQSRGAFRTAYGETTLRERFGLPRPASRYAAGAGAAVVPTFSGATA